MVFSFVQAQLLPIIWKYYTFILLKTLLKSVFKLFLLIVLKSNLFLGELGTYGASFAVVKSSYCRVLSSI